MKIAIEMLLVCMTSRWATTTAFTGVSRLSRSSSRLNASFLENLQRTFSSAVLAPSGSTNSKYFTVGITGSSGLVGTALLDELQGRSTVNGKPVRVVRLRRGTVDADNADVTLEDAAQCSLTWNPNGASISETISLAALDEMDAVIHLAGENVSTGQGPLGFLGLRPWTDAKKQEILDSRVTPTLALSQAMAASKRPQTLVTASGVGIYGDTFIGDALPAVDESAPTSDTKGFLADISRAWEGATSEATKKGNNRVVQTRFGVVLSTKGGAMAKVYPIFFLGGGGDVGSGQQYFPFVSARDLARALVHVLETPSLKGPVNVCAPNPCTNSDYTKALGKCLNRPTILPLPAFAVSLLFGEMGEALLLGGVRCLPTKLQSSGFSFMHPTVDSAVQSALSEKI